MDNNNQQNINTQQQPPTSSIPPTPKKLGKKIITIGALIVAVAVIIYIVPKYWDVAGGGATTQTAPDSIKAGEATTIKFEVSVPGSKQNIKGRYTDIFLYYQITGQDILGQIQPKLLSEDNIHEVYEFTIPPYPNQKSGEITYYIELKLDGHANRIEGYKKIKIGESIASINGNSSFKTWYDGTGYVKGEVIDHISGCEVDGACKLIVQTGDQKIALVYAEGDMQCLNTQAASWVNWGKNVSKGTVVKAYGAYKKLGSEQRLTFCGSKDYFILGANDPVPVGPYTEKFFDEVADRMSGTPILSTDKKSIIVEGKILLTIDDESILNYFRDPRTQLCDASNITSTPDRKSFCTDKSTFKNITRFASIVISPDKTKIGFTIESDTLSPDTVVGMFYLYRATSRVNFLSNYYLGNEFISFSPNGTNFVFKHNCFENDCGISVKNSDTLSDDITNFGMLPDHTDYRFVKWISDKEIEYKDGTELKRASF